MSIIQTIPTISEALLQASAVYTQYCHSIPDHLFFGQPEGKWSPAQQTKHLITSTNMARLAFTLPGFMVRMIGGKPNRPSRSYDELVKRYHDKLVGGGQASGRYIPKPIPASTGREKWLRQYETSMIKIAGTIGKIKQEERLDQYLAPHPLLGKITLRELTFFTIYHSHHHLDSIRKMTGS
ncbi:MAG: DinB family protein [Chitinophagaceae bacterium]|nr:DinB family protein [Chitinophagaceae bacterium]MBP8244886.1 DinB family protein [Chitinophagaceae bacterium]